MRQRVFPYAHYNELSRSHDLILFFIPPLLESRLLLSLCVFPRVFFSFASWFLGTTPSFHYLFFCRVILCVFLCYLTLLCLLTVVFCGIPFSHSSSDERGSRTLWTVYGRLCVARVFVIIVFCDRGACLFCRGSSTWCDVARTTVGWNGRLCLCRQPDFVLRFLVFFFLRSGEENGVEGWDFPDFTPVGSCLYIDIFILYPFSILLSRYLMLENSNCTTGTRTRYVGWTLSALVGNMALLARYFPH
jgi:hypothetical protein